MLTEIFLSLGMLLSSAPGPEAPMGVFEALRPAQGAPSPMPLLRSAPPLGIPVPASREESSIAAPEEKEEEPDHFLIDWAVYDRRGIPAIGRQDAAIAIVVPGHGFLRQLHHSWQLLC